MHFQVVEAQAIGAAKQENGLANLPWHARVLSARVTWHVQQAELSEGFGVQDQRGIGLAK